MQTTHTEKYTLGIDFGSLSGRAVLVRVTNGDIVAQATFDYPHAVMSETLPNSDVVLPHDYALQHPQDYLDVLSHTIPAVLKQSGIDSADVIGLGVDFTACTVMPVYADGTPLCFNKQYVSEKHAYVKMWKHHAAQPYATRLNEIARQRGEKWLARYGGSISSEWYYPKLWEILDQAPQVYHDMAYFIEATDWITWMLTGELCRNSCTAGYKELWHKQDGDLSSDFLKALDPRLENAPAEKLNAPVRAIGTRAGGLTRKMAEMTGLKEGTAVSVASVDAHASVPAAGITESGNMLAIIGTSTCHMMLGDSEINVPGMCGVVQDGILPGKYGYESGQSCVGDHFAWFMQHCCPAEVAQKATEQGMDVFGYMEQCAAKLSPGQSGLVALDWWNGNRSILVDADLSGLMLGMTLSTRPEEMYRALIEATAYGTRTIVENYRTHGLPVHAFYACGGIAQKSPLIMQIYADVLNMEVKIVDSTQAPALGTAILAAAVAPKEAGGYDSIEKAAQAMAKIRKESYHPDQRNVLIYDKLYREYMLLHDWFGRGGNDVMKRLKALKAEITK